MSFLGVENKIFVVFGLANKKSVATAIARNLVEEGAEVIHVVRSAERAVNASKLFPQSQVFICDVEDEANIIRVRDEIGEAIGGAEGGRIDGIVHSIAFANYSEGMKPFHETRKDDFLQAVNVSCFSFISIANHFKGLLTETWFGGDDNHLHHPDGRGELWVYGTNQSRPGLVALFSGQEFLGVFQGSV